MSTFQRLEREHVLPVIEIDRMRFHQKPSEVALQNAQRNPWMYTILTLDDVVQGYGLVIPVTKFAHAAMKKGEMSEDELLARHVAYPDECAAFYIASLASAQATHLVVRSRLVGYTLGSILRIPKETFAIAVSRDGDSVAREIVGMDARSYQGPLQGINGYQPVLFVKPAFTFRN